MPPSIMVCNVKSELDLIEYDDRCNDKRTHLLEAVEFGGIEVIKALSKATKDCVEVV